MLLARREPDTDRMKCRGKQHLSRLLTILSLWISLVTICVHRAWIVNPTTSRSAAPSSSQSTWLPPMQATIEGFGACIMLKEDNDLFYEWLAYHYTVLPLRFIVVGSDVGNQQDPNQVLERWRVSGMPLRYKVLNVTDWDIFHETTTTSINSQSDVSHAHHSFVRRQKGFITTCAKLLKSWGVGWTTFIDSDEFVTWNTQNSGNRSTLIDTDIQGLNHQSIQEVLARNRTVLDTLTTLEWVGAVGACYTLPRLRFGSLENQTVCPGAQEPMALARAHFRLESLSTIRYVQHARKGDFRQSKFGKVMVDLSKLDDTFLSKTLPRNIHRPYLPYCGPGAKALPSSLFRLNHYTGSWERYASRVDARRNRTFWEEMAVIADEVACDDAEPIFQWLFQFIQNVGGEIARAQFLLGVFDEDYFLGRRS